MDASPKGILSSRIEILLGAEAAESIAEYVSETFKAESDFEDNATSIQNYLQDILGDSSAVTAMAKEYRMLSKKRNNISSRIEQSKNVPEEPSTTMGMSTSVGFGEVNKKQQKNASGVLGNAQINFSKDDKNRGRSNQNRAAFATNSNTIDMKMNDNPGMVCGCMGTRHKLFGSCLSCGRVTCEMEYKNNGIPKETDENDESASNTPIKTPKTISSVIKSLKKVEEVLEPVISSGEVLCNCFTCGHPVCAPMSTDDLTKQGSTLDTSSIAAYQQKDKLLVFDREHAKRTHVHDAQADYYETGTWLTEEEKKEMDDSERKRREAKKPSNRKFKMSFDIAGRRIIEAMDDDEEQNVGEYIEKYNKKDKSTCKDVQDDYYSTIVSDDENDFQDCNPHTHEKDTDNNNDENGDDKNHTVSGFGHGVNNGKNNRNNNFHSGKEKRAKNTENKTESVSTGQQNTVLQVIENDMLSNNMGKTGDIYRSLRSSMAERAIKNDEITRNAGVKKEKESKIVYNDEAEEEGGKGGRGDDNDPTSSKSRNRNRNKNKQSSS